MNPHISYPVFQGKKHLSQRLHEIRRDHAVKKIDNRCPALYMHQHVKLKRLQQIEEGNLALQIDNRNLAERILKNMVRKSQIDCYRLKSYWFLITKINVFYFTTLKNKKLTDFSTIKYFKLLA